MKLATALKLAAKHGEIDGETENGTYRLRIDADNVITFRVGGGASLACRATYGLAAPGVLYAITRHRRENEREKWESKWCPTLAAAICRAKSKTHVLCRHKDVAVIEECYHGQGVKRALAGKVTFESSGDLVLREVVSSKPEWETLMEGAIAGGTAGPLLDWLEENEARRAGGLVLV